MYDVYETDMFIYLVLQLVNGGELLDKIQRIEHFSERAASSIIKQILEAVDYLHKGGVVHRDLKPDNLLTANTSDNNNIHIYVCDFGLSRLFEGVQEFTTFCGSPEYVAPEILSQVPYGKEVDLWSIGVIAYILLTGFLPFSDKVPDVLVQKIQNVDYNWSGCPPVSSSAKHFVNSLLKKDPKQRLPTEKALTHPWVLGRNVKDDNASEIVSNMQTYQSERKGLKKAY